jgi:hypothetical protein
MRNLLIACVFVAAGAAFVTAQPAPTRPPVLNQIADIKISDILLARLKAKISGASTASGHASSTSDLDVNELYRRLLAFKDDRKSYTEALKNYSDVLRNHTGFSEIVYRDEAYYRLIRAADLTLQSLKGFSQYLRETGIATHQETEQLDSVLERFIEAKGTELRSVTDSVGSGNFSADDIKRISDQAEQNGKALDSELTILQKMLIAKGATIQRPPVIGMSQ